MENILFEMGSEQEIARLIEIERAANSFTSLFYFVCYAFCAIKCVWSVNFSSEKSLIDKCSWVRNFLLMSFNGKSINRNKKIYLEVFWGALNKVGF